MFDKLLSVVAPHECAGCGTEGRILCAVCTGGLVPAVARCYRCHRAIDGWRTCPGCRRESKLFAVLALAKYEDTAEALVQKLKFSGAVAAAEEIARLMTPLLPADDNLVVTHLPTATGRVRSRGFDQAELITRELSKHTKLPYIRFLARSGQTRQVGASRAARQAQASQAYRVCNRSLLVGATIVLVDDVITTGASLEAAANALRANGAKRVYGLVFCQA